MLKIIKYLFFLYIVSVAHGKVASESDIDFRASLTVKKGVFSGANPLNATLHYLNDKMFQWLSVIKDTPVLRTLSNFFTPENENSKVKKQVLRQSSNIYPKQSLELYVSKLIQHYIKKGSFRLSQAYKDFNKILRIGRSAGIEIDIESKYNTHMAKHMKKILLRKENSNSQLDTQLILLDIIENCYRFMLIEGADVWNKMSHQSRSHKELPEPTTHKMLSEFVKGSIVHKIHDYDYLCNETKLCRSFPGYFDYFGDILEKVKSMPDKKVLSILTKTIRVLRSRHEKLSWIFGSEIADRFIKVLEKAVQLDIKDTKTFLVSSYDYIKHRRFWKPYMKSENIVGTVLMDMIDKPFAVDVDRRIRNGQFVHNELEREFSSLLSALDQSIYGMNVEPTLAHFADYTIKNIDQSWDQDTKREAITIIEVLLDGKTNSNEMYTRLLSEGSQYLNSQK